MKSSDQKKNLFSIITPVYNGGVYFESLILSVKNQTESDFEHVVIDDGSTDGITRKLLRKYSHIRYWSQANQGQYYAMNDGLEEATGEWVCFICADDLLARDALQKVKKVILQHPECEMVWGKGYAVREDGSKYEVQPPLQRYIGFHRYLAHVPHCSIYVKKDYLIKNKINFDTNLHFVADYFWILHLLESRPNKRFINSSLSFHRMHPEQATQKKRDSILAEKIRVRKDRGRSHALYLLIHWALKFRSALIRIIHKTKKEGIKAGIIMAIEFVHNRFSSD